MINTNIYQDISRRADGNIYMGIVGPVRTGKSTFINSYAGKACAKTGNKPGVTKGKQWIRLSKNVELLDTPGILWPKFDEENVALNIAATGGIRSEILNMDEICIHILDSLHCETNTIL